MDPGCGQANLIKNSVMKRCQGSLPVLESATTIDISTIYGELSQFLSKACLIHKCKKEQVVVSGLFMSSSTETAAGCLASVIGSINPNEALGTDAGDRLRRHQAAHRDPLAFRSGIPYLSFRHVSSSCLALDHHHIHVRHLLSSSSVNEVKNLRSVLFRASGQGKTWSQLICDFL